MPLDSTPDFSSVEFSASESFTVKFFTTDKFDDEDDIPKLKLPAGVGCSATSLDVVTSASAATGAVDTSEPNVKLLIATLSGVAATADVETSAVEVAVAERVTSLAIGGLVCRCGVSRRLTGVEFVP